MAWATLAVALGTCSAMALLSSHAPGAEQATDMRWGTRHGDSVGWNHSMGPGGDKSDPASHTCPVLFGTLPACCCHSIPCAPALRSPDAKGQQHSPAPRPPTPRPPTPRPPAMGTPDECQGAWAVGQHLICSSPRPMCDHPYLGSFTPPMPWECTPSFLGSTPLPTSHLGSTPLPTCPRCLGSAPTWDAANPWDSNPGNTCQREDH